MNLIQILLAAIASQAERPVDNTPKSVGDKVEMSHPRLLGYFVDVETGQQLSIDGNPVSEDIAQLFTCLPMVVVANNLHKEFKCGHCDQDHYHDLIVYVPGAERRYFTSSIDVHIIETE